MSNQLKKINVVALYTFKEILKSRIVINVCGLGLLLALITYVASEFTFGVPSRVALDFGFGTLTLTSIGVAIFLGVGLLSQEIENRTVYMVLSRPIQRSSFLAGRVLGMMWIQVLNMIILGGLSLSIYFLFGGNFQSLILWTFLFILLESLLVLLIVVLFSLIANKIIAVCNTVILLMCGHVLNDTKLIAFIDSYPIIKTTLTIYGYIFPNFYKLNLKDFVLYNQTLPLNYLWMNLFYGVSYSIFLLTLSCLIFQNKNLD